MVHHFKCRIVGNSWLRPQGTDPPTSRPPQGVTGGGGTGLDSITTDQQRGQVRTIKTKLFMAPNFCSCHDHHHHRHYTASSLLLFSHIWIKCSVVSNQLFMCVWEHTHIPHRSCRRTKLTERATDRTRQPGGPINIS